MQVYINLFKQHLNPVQSAIYFLSLVKEKEDGGRRGQWVQIWLILDFWSASGFHVARSSCGLFSSQQLESLAWYRDGTQFMTAHADGSYIVWATNDSTKPKEQANTPYGKRLSLRPLQAILVVPLPTYPTTSLSQAWSSEDNCCHSYMIKTFCVDGCLKRG